MKNRILAIAAAALALLITSCGKIHEISVNSYDIVSVTPSGFRSVDAVIAVGIHNPAFAFKVSDIHGTVYHNGSALADFEADPVDVHRKSDDVYQITGRARLAKGVSVLSLLSLIQDMNPEDYSLDASAKVKAKGFTKTISRTGVPVSRLTNR